MSGGVGPCTPRSLPIFPGEIRVGREISVVRRARAARPVGDFLGGARWFDSAPLMLRKRPRSSRTDDVASMFTGSVTKSAVSRLRSHLRRGAREHLSRLRRPVALI